MENVQPAQTSVPLLHNPYQVGMSSSDLTIVAWVVTVLISTVPDIVLSELGSGVPNWVPAAKIGLLVVMTLAAILWKPLRPTLGQLVQVIPILPSILFYAALNAFTRR